MYFTVLDVGTKPPTEATGQAFLIMDDRDDWGKFKTQYALIIFDSKGIPHHIGDVKIGQFLMKQERPAIPSTFNVLKSSFFSLGQDDTYYERLHAQGMTICKRVLNGLRDIAADENRFNKAKDETVTIESLLRSVTGVTAQGQFRRLAKGRKRLTSFKFKYTGAKPTADGVNPVELSFDVEPDSRPPTNIHVLIGPNGVGKTHVLERMARALLNGPDSTEDNGTFEQLGKNKGENSFANVVSVTFSAFDPFEPLPDRRGETHGIRYAYVGLKTTSKNVAPGTLKNLNILATDFAKSLATCATSSKAERWRGAVTSLEADPIFKAANVSALIDGFADGEEPHADWKKSIDKLADDATSLFLTLSTGHKTVLLTITRLVETVEERTLILFDEPESHLHPPLLSAFIRALSDLLTDRNGVAILSTHSPVVLQEVPASCAWKLQRYGDVIQAERPELDTFGENLGVLTREVFCLEVRQSGFHKMLQEVVNGGGNYEAVLKSFGNALGAEARALVRTLIAGRNSTGDE